MTIAWNNSYLNRTVNKAPRPPGLPYKIRIWHETQNGSGNPYQTLDWNLYERDPRTNQLIQSSYNALVARNGECFGYVDPRTFTAYHAGTSRVKHRGVTYNNFEVNLIALGVEGDGPVNRARYKSTDAQLIGLAEWAIWTQDIMLVPLLDDFSNDFTHEQVAGSNRRTDPKAYTLPEVYEVIRELQRRPVGEGSSPMPIPIFAKPSITLETWTRILERGYQGKPSQALAEAQPMYEALVKAGVDPVVFLGIAWRECKLMTVGRSVEWRNPGNVRTPADPSKPHVIVPTEKGQFVAYPSWTAAVADWALRMETKYKAQRGITTLETMIPVYYPPWDQGNDTERYLADVQARIAEYRAMGYPLGEYEITVGTALVREGPGRQYPIALGGTAKPTYGNRFVVDEIKKGAPYLDNPYWLKRADNIGFVHSSVAAPLAR